MSRNRSQDQNGLMPDPQMLKDVVEGQAQIRQQLSNVEGQNNFLVQQLLQFSSVFSQQSNAFLEGETALRNELKRFQTGGPQHAMSAVYSKLFRDLLKHMEHLDSLAELGAQEQRSPQEQSWVDAIIVMRGSLETILKDWGCTPIPIQVGKDVFDPEIHESVPAGSQDIPPGTSANTIVRVQRRGWRLHDVIIQYPQVLVS
ncbi:MAG: nucleotide exchange factor GrpE [Chloroflexota bacterium]